jgi:o-succinylbenzoate synthase
MPLTLNVYRIQETLKAPYQLSFASINSFDTFYITIEGEGSLGMGEITLLPGYNHETSESVLKELRNILEVIKSDPNDAALEACIDDMSERAPFVASGMTCALETWKEGEKKAFQNPVATSAPLVALCQGSDVDDIVREAQRLFALGYTTLKMKVGLNQDKEIDKVYALLDFMGDKCSLRLDANQAMDYSYALTFCRSLEHTDRVILEQPFVRENFDAHTSLASSTSVPIMLDESIWTEDDIRRAADSNIRFIKLKLCKHKGIQGSLDMVSLSREHDLQIVYGNGVQTALGNHLEARVYSRSSLETAIESNGFLKINDPLISHELKISDGKD